MVTTEHMDIFQVENLEKCRDALVEFRHRADYVMYGSAVPLSDENFNELRKAYDYVCRALDLLP